MLSLRRLRYFVVLAQELHYRRAAELLHVAQPALSQQIRVLEEELGVTLFRRDRRGVALTGAGEILLTYAQKITDLSDSAVASLKRASGLSRSTIRVAYTRSALPPVVSSLIDRFHSEYPDTYVELRSGWTRLNFDDLLHGRVDVAFVRPLIDHPQIKGLEICRERLVLALPLDHPLSKIDKATPVLLREHPVILLPGQYELFRHQLWVEGPPMLAREEPDEAHALMAVAGGHGMFVLPEAWAMTLRVDGVIIKPFVAPEPELPLLVAFNDETATPNVKNFIRVARSLRAQPVI